MSSQQQRAMLELEGRLLDKLEEVARLQRELISRVGGLHQELQRARRELLATMIASEYARVVARKLSLRSQLNYLSRKFEEVSELFYDRYRTLVVEYLKNIRDYLRQFLDMAEPEFSVLRKVASCVKSSESFAELVEPTWIDEELVEVVVGADLKARVEDMKQLVSSMEELYRKLSTQAELRKSVFEVIERHSLPTQLAKPGTVLYLPVLVVEVEVDGRKLSWTQTPFDSKAPLALALASEAYNLREKHAIKLGAEEKEKIVAKLATMAKDPEERKLIEGAEVEVV
jgi:hypothetical protein